MFLLFPGRHHLLTNFQFNYIYKFINNTQQYSDPLKNRSISAVIFAVTSANHQNTRRNPVPFYVRVIQITQFAHGLNRPCYIYPIDDAGSIDDFASYTIKTIAHESDMQHILTAENTIVLCSTPVMTMYEKLGFSIAHCELLDREKQTYAAPLPWEIVEHIAGSPSGQPFDDYVLAAIHPSSYQVWEQYGLADSIRNLFKDPIIGDDGDLTATRDYNTYVRQMDEIADLKYTETAPFIIPGRIGDIGCAVGSWIKRASSEKRFHESEFYGIEVARQLYTVCEQRKDNGEFSNPFVFFSQKNAVTGLVFASNSMNTVHTSSLTHEIYSYGSLEDLQRFITNRVKELKTGGVWINRDVLGPENADMTVYLYCTDTDGDNDAAVTEGLQGNALCERLNALSTYARFEAFARDFGKARNKNIKYKKETIEGRAYFKLSLRHACEYLYKKDYADNWQSEMHESFCFWSYSDWVGVLTAQGFSIMPGSRPFRNEWIVKNRLIDKTGLFILKDGKLVSMDFPDTHCLLVAKKQ